jgi:hypothetical protein
MKSCIVVVFAVVADVVVVMSVIDMLDKQATFVIIPRIVM